MTQHFQSITLTQAIRHAAVFFIATTFATAKDVELNGRTFTIPDGFQLELVTNHTLTKRPIVVDFDDDGNLYVAESSGTNDNVQIQLEQKPHSILRLTDVDDDGIFDKRTNDKGAIAK